MTEEKVKILWEREWRRHWKSHAYLDDGNERLLCGLPVPIFAGTEEPPPHKKCKRCLKIVARREEEPCVATEG